MLVSSVLEVSVQPNLREDTVFLKLTPTGRRSTQPTITEKYSIYLNIYGSGILLDNTQLFLLELLL